MEMQSTKLLVFDGGIGTELYERGFYINRLFEELNLTHPKDVQAVHEAYASAGATVITTNTFSCNSWVLEKFGIQDQKALILKEGIRLAKEVAVQHNIQCAVSFGPSGLLIEPLGPLAKSDVQNEYADLTKILTNLPPEARPDFIILETFSSIPELDCAIKGIRSVNVSIPIIASMTVSSIDSDFLSDFAKKITDKKVQWLGLNCSEGPNGLLEALKVLRPLTTLPILIQPNAGIPRNINGRYFYMTSPDYIAKFAKRFIEAGAQGVGGCCGTGPDHIRAISQSVKMLSAQSVSNTSNISGGSSVGTEQDHSPKAPPRAWSERKESDIGQILGKGGKVWTIEMTPPKGANLEKFLPALEQVKKAGIPFVNVPDGARASTRVSSLHIAAYVNSRPELGIKILPHFTTRDRNLIALQSDLLGAYLNGVHDLLLVTGDPPKLGVSKDATAVYDIDSIGLTYLAKQLNLGLSANDETLGSKTNFGIGVAANPTAINLELEMKRWGYKVESGADFAVTQPIYDPESFFRWRDSIGAKYRPHIIGIWPFVSLKNAEFMAHEVPGVHVPRWAIERMQKVADDPAASIQEGVAIAREVVRKLERECEGFAVSAPLGKVEVALEVFKS